MDSRQLSRKIDLVIIGYIPHHTTCRFEEQKREALRLKEKNIILDKIAGLDVSFSAEWVPLQPDMSICMACKEVIYGTQYQLQYIICAEVVEPDKPVKLCEMCYSKINK